MLDLVVSTPWILIYQILPFVSTFGMSFSRFTSPLFFLRSLSGKISECVVWVVEAVVVLLDDLVFSTPDSESWI